MNPNGAFWWDLVGRLMLESSALIAVAALVGRKLLPQQQRTVWQAALGALLLLLAVEGTGLHQRLHFSVTQAPPSPASRRLTMEVMPGGQITPRSPAEPNIGRPSLGAWLPGMIWLAVCGGILARTFGSRLLFVAWRHRRHRVNDPALRQRVDALARQMNLRGPVHLSESCVLVSPIAFGFLRRCICVPDTFGRSHTAREQEVMLAHEMAHLAARDPFWYALVDLAAAAFWFNPLVWFGRAKFQTASETAADEASLLVSEDGARTLAECLVQLGKRMAHVNSYGWIGIEGNRFRSTLGRRVTRLLKLDGTRWRALPAGWAVATWCIVAMILVALLGSSAAFARGPSYSLADLLWQLRWAGRDAAVGSFRVQTAPVPNTSPAQLTIEARFVELSDPQDILELRGVVNGADEQGTNSFRRILPPSRYRDLIKRLEARAGVDILATPRVTTLSGRQAQIKVVDIKYVVTDLGVLTNAPEHITEPFEVGPVLDVIPEVGPDGMSIQMKLISSVREFLGYNVEQPYFDSGPPRALTPTPLREYVGEKNASPINSIQPPGPNSPQPVFRLRRAETMARVWDGQTVVLGLSPSAEPPVKRNLKFTRSGKPCFLFVTPVLIDPAGNRLHEESTMPFVEQTAP